jgi:hypothetical protein
MRYRAPSTLRSHVGHIFLLRSSEEVAWVAAGRIVARMEDLQAFWNGADR